MLGERFAQSIMMCIFINGRYDSLSLRMKNFSLRFLKKSILSTTHHEHFV